MSSEDEKVASFEEFRTNVLPHVEKLGYDTLQIMALQEHPYYGSFGYQVSNFYALSSRFGTPEEFKHLVDDAARARYRSGDGYRPFPQRGPMRRKVLSLFDGT